MSKREEVHVGEEEILKQKELMRDIRDKFSGKKKKYFISTFGCQMNEHDSEKLDGMLFEMGFDKTSILEESNLVIFNTCCVRENAEQKVYGHLGALKKFKEEKEDFMIAICGCMMQQNKVIEHIKKSYRFVDLIFGTHNLYKFPELLMHSFASTKTVIDVWESAGSIAEEVPIVRKDGVKAWVTVMYGCNNFCAYCIVPYVRGRERSRRIEDVVREVEELGRTGFKEITLLGQNVNSYGNDLAGTVNFADLLKELNKIDGIERIRFMTSHPKDLSEGLIYAMRDLNKVCEYLHLPVQAGSSNVLTAMNRQYSKEKYLELVEKIKAAIPGVTLSTDIIVGFPGETEQDFEDTLDVVRKVRFDAAYTFLYSRRTGTPAAKSEEQVPEDIKKARFDRLLDLQNSISREINETYLGQDVEVLVEGLSKTNDQRFTGRTRTNKIVNFDANADLTGKQVMVRIEKIQTWSLEGSLVDS